MNLTELETMGLQVIPGHPNYMASVYGEIFSLMPRFRVLPRRMKLWNNKGYRRVEFMVGGEPKSFLVHRLVAATFIGPCPEGLEVNHIDGNRSNNYVTNLEYVTSRGNAANARMRGSLNFGAKHHSAKLTAESVRQIRSIVASGITKSQAARNFGVSPVTIGRIISGRIWAHVDRAAALEAEAGEEPSKYEEKNL